MAKNWRDHLESATWSTGLYVQGHEAASPPGLTILAHPDVERVGERAALTGLLASREERLSRLEPLFTPVHGGAPRPLADPHLSRRPVLFQAGDGGIRLDTRSASGRLRVDGTPFDGSREVSSTELAEGIVLLLGSRVAVLLHRLSPILQPTEAFGLVGASSAVLALHQEIRRVARGGEDVLLRGETGTGKELVAQAVHQAGPRASGPLVAVNMGGLVPSLAQAELFGAERGAFTGAERARDGYFREADGGTLFLDEIGAAPPEVQVLLLRALEEKRVRPVGARRDVAVDVRVVAATDTDLPRAMGGGAFHSPLYYRLSRSAIDLAPLRDRREDVGRLLLHFLRREIPDAVWTREPPWLPADLVDRLARASWPGNVRQLRNVAHELAVHYQDAPAVALDARVERLLAEAYRLPDTDTGASSAGRPGPGGPDEAGGPRRFAEEDVREALRAAGYAIASAARRLGVPRSTMYELMRRHGIRTAAELNAEDIERAAASSGSLPRAAERLEVSHKALVGRVRELGLDVRDFDRECS